MYVKNNRKGRLWLSGFIVKETGPVSFQVKLDDGKTIVAIKISLDNVSVTMTFQIKMFCCLMIMI